MILVLAERGYLAMTLDVHEVHGFQRHMVLIVD